jgi:MoxR-like ATPase
MEDQNVEFESALQNDINVLNQRVLRIRQEIGKVVIGQESIIDLLLAGIFTGGHILLEGVPGIAKTLTAKLVARALSVSFSRIQFTPDLMPTDVTGTTVFNVKTSEFTFNKGPVFANLVLIDEINRAPAKTQSSLFEVMEERQITMDGITYPMEFPFLVIATQNPIEQEGTYRLPEAQLDRFLFRLKLKYPTVDQEIQILRKFKEDFTLKVLDTVQAVVSREELKHCQELIEKIHIKDEIIQYIAGHYAVGQSHRRHERPRLCNTRRCALCSHPRAQPPHYPDRRTRARRRGSGRCHQRNF